MQAETAGLTLPDGAGDFFQFDRAQSRPGPFDRGARRKQGDDAGGDQA